MASNVGTVQLGQDAGAAPSSLPFGLSPRAALVLGGGVVVAIVVFVARSRSAPAPAPASDENSQVAGPNAALAIGSLESRLQERTGRLEELVAGRSDELKNLLGSLGSQISDLGTSQASQAQMEALEAHQIRTQIQALTDPTNAEWYQKEYYQWVRDAMHLELNDDALAWMESYFERHPDDTDRP